MVNFKEDEKLNKLNHSCAHLLAQAVKHLYPQAKFWVGPVVEEGFYYDIDLGDDVLKEEVKTENTEEEIIFHDDTPVEEVKQVPGEKNKLAIAKSRKPAKIKDFFMEILIPVASGLEQTVKRQLFKLGYEKTPADNGRVSLSGDWQDVARLNVF